LIRLLLDTNVWIWALQEPGRLSRAAHRVLDDPENEIHLSPISIWEAQHLARKRKLKLRGTFQEWLWTARERAPMREAPLSFAVAMEMTNLQLPQPDVGDLMLAATAIAGNLTLLTTDEQLLNHPAIKTLRAD
jgi:PIN domain nuclease of toxin-antitoxin system